MIAKGHICVRCIRDTIHTILLSEVANVWGKQTKEINKRHHQIDL